MSTIARKRIFLVIVIMISTLIQCYDSICDSPQYLELGKSGKIDCSLPEEYFILLWYTADDFEKDTPSLKYQHLVKTGTGYISGEFDIFPNGSLIITNVTLMHETTFTVAYTRSEEEHFQVMTILVNVIVKPEVPYPVIDLCNGSDTCYDETDGALIQCSVIDVRPKVSLSLMARTVNGDKNISTNVSIIPREVGYTSIVTTRHVFRSSSLLALLVCTASSPPGILKKNNSMILLENTDVDVDQLKTEIVYIKRGTLLKLSCTEKEINFFVWKKASPPHYKYPKTVLYSVTKGEGFAEIMDDDVILEDRFFLTIYSTKIKHEGLYFCLFGDGLSDGITAYNIHVIVPAYPEVVGCNQPQYCILEADYTGSLTCTVKGIRPEVQLRWKTFSEEDTNLISITNHRLTVKQNNNTFDVTLIAQYRFREVSSAKVPLVCELVSSQKEFFGLTVRTDLLFVKGDDHPTDPSYTNLTWLIFCMVAFFVMFVLCGGITIRYLRKQSHDEEITVRFKKRQAEVEGLFVHSKDLRQQFLNQLRVKYQDLYDKVQPIPYIKDRLYCVDRVFVEVGIEYLSSSSEGRTEVQWTSLKSYQNVVNNSNVSSTRCILEGEPGYGKSTIALQFAYDWCNSVPASALSDVDILILLRLRQLGGVSSIYRAIKQFILPKDSRLSESDIETILQDSNSVVIILDGFDEYPDQDSNTFDIISIIARQMFQNFEVVLTTRSSFLPKNYPASTKRIRLTGFNKNARRYYIRKAVVGNNDDESVERIEGYLEENPILSDLCQVPLLFVIFAHMTYDSEDFRKLNSVTSFFRYMISCFHSHMKNKMNEENVSRYELFETDHGVLDKVAFEAFSGNSQRIVWKKEELCEQLGREFYDQYVSIGILVEEEVMDITDNPSTPITEHVQYKTEVRFYHKLFCEWYAAHYISNYLQDNPNVDVGEFLHHLDPFDVQYMYRFLCGLNAGYAEEIINYLKHIEGGDKFAILCIIEQGGEKVHYVKETIRQLCFEGVIISRYDSQLLQRSSLQLLEIAARNNIPIEYVYLTNCFEKVDRSTAAIKTTSGLLFTSRIPVKRLVVSLYREMTEEEAIAILEFSSWCSTLQYLRYGGCVPPQKFKDKSILSSLRKRDVKVWWSVCKDEPTYILNLRTGRWKNNNDGTVPTAEDVERMLSKSVQVRTQRTEETYKRLIKDGRETLRKGAEKRQRDAKEDG